MVFSVYNVIGMLVFMALGLACLWIFHRFIYPLLSARYEKAKVTLTQGRDPARLSRVVYLVSLLLLPALGFVLGGILHW
jgi:hypothetical protein